MLEKATLWTNGIVTCFDEHGEQIPRLQGKFEDVKDSIERESTDDTIFEFGKWNDACIAVDKERWMANTFGVYPEEVIEDE